MESSESNNTFQTALRTVKKAERVRVCFEILLDELGKTYQDKRSDVWAAMLELHEKEQEALKTIGTLYASASPKKGSKRQQGDPAVS